MTQELKLSNTGSILGLRELAKCLSSAVRDAILSDSGIVLDFDGVESVSSSFADELIAKVFIEFGGERFLKCVKIRNANDFVKTIINSSINERLKETKQ